MKIKLSIYYVILFMLFLAQSGPLTAHSEEIKGEVSISPMLGLYVFDHEQDIEKDFIGALGLAYNLTENWACEFMVNYGRFNYKYFNLDSCACETEKINGLAIHLDALYHFRPDKKLVPYLAAGFSDVLLDEDCDPDYYPGINYGGGIKYFLNEDLALRLDARHIYDLDESNNNAVITLGLTFQFGGDKKTAPVLLDATPALPGPSVVTPSAPAVSTPTVSTPAVSDSSSAPVPVVTPPPAAPAVPIDEYVPAPVKESVTIDMKLRFAFDSAEILPENHDAIKKLADSILEYPDTEVEIEGHTCNMGPAAYNQKLSERRAESMKKYLIDNFNIPADRITTHGYGMTRPIADNRTRDGRMKNRRVHVIVSND